jgi:predicted dehydrogenase
MDLGCYAIYSAVALLGPPEAVSYTPVMLPTGVDAGGTVVLKYPDSVATLVISKCSHSWCHSEIQTENGTIRINNLGEWSEVHTQQKGGAAEPVSTEGPGGLDNLVYEIDAFVKMVQAGETQDATLTWDLALQVAKVLDQARDDAGIVFPADAGR